MHGSFFLAKGVEGPGQFTQWVKIIFGPSNCNPSPHHEFKNKQKGPSASPLAPHFRHLPSGTKEQDQFERWELFVGCIFTFYDFISRSILDFQFQYKYDKNPFKYVQTVWVQYATSQALGYPIYLPVCRHTVKFMELRMPEQIYCNERKINVPLQKYTKK